MFIHLSNHMSTLLSIRTLIHGFYVLAGGTACRRSVVAYDSPWSASMCMDTCIGTNGDVYARISTCLCTCISALAVTCRGHVSQAWAIATKYIKAVAMYSRNCIAAQKARISDSTGIFAFWMDVRLDVRAAMCRRGSVA